MTVIRVVDGAYTHQSKAVTWVHFPVSNDLEKYHTKEPAVR